MKVTSSKFIASYTSVKDCPDDGLPAYVFIGRSNVGKSSLINMLTHKKGLAKVSGTPGKTQLINYFLINEEWYLVDLPGYGYARSSKSERKKWITMIRNVLKYCPNMLYVFQLIDSRIPPQASDLEYINWMGENGVPFVNVFTKMDKPGSKGATNNVKDFQKELKKTWQALPLSFSCSSEKKWGRDEILNFVTQTNKTFASMLGEE